MRATAVVLLAGVLAAPAGASITSQYAIPAHPDGRDVAGGLDVAAVAFGQRDLKMVLRVRTRSPWRVRGLRKGRSLCLRLTGGRVCLAQGRTRAGAVYQRAVGAGFGPPHGIPVSVRRLDPRTVRVTFAPRNAGLGVGAFRWSLEARTRDAGACTVDCVDRVPDSGVVAGSVRVLAQPPCFGAAARDPLHPCRNAELEHTVFPRPDAAYVWPNAPCRPLRPSGAVFNPCGFGVPAAAARATFALVGDSHAAHWRAALEVVAQARRWRGVSITRPGCPFSTQIPSSPSLGPADCVRQHDATLAWLRAHRSVRRLFVSNWAQPPGGPQGGIGGYGGGAGSFGAMLDRLPRSVRRVYVLRDIPRTLFRDVRCAEARGRRGLLLRNHCGTPRAAALTPDPGAAAAVGRRPRVRVLDLTHLFCDAARCYPVIGGVYLHKDHLHMNAVFSTSLGPFVLRALRSG